MIPASQGMGYKSQARACVWWLFAGWPWEGCLPSLSLSFHLFSSLVGQARRSRHGAGRRPCENQAALASGPTTSQRPPLSLRLQPQSVTRCHFCLQGH